jgi:hypothetical protein
MRDVIKISNLRENLFMRESVVMYFHNKITRFICRVRISWNLVSLMYGDILSSLIQECLSVMPQLWYFLPQQSRTAARVAKF